MKTKILVGASFVLMLFLLVVQKRHMRMIREDPLVEKHTRWRNKVAHMNTKHEYLHVKEE